MAIFRPGPSIGAISGNLGGACFVQSKAGPVIRQRNVRTKNTSKRHLQLRALMKQLRAAWKNLTPDQHTAWNQSASQVLFTNRLGIPTLISGYNLFIKLNAFGQYTIPVNPAFIFSDPAEILHPPVLQITSFDIVAGGAKTAQLLNPTRLGNEQYFAYCARTYSTADRKSWNQWRLVFATVTPSDTLILHTWNDDIGDPIPGEQCWLKLFFGRTQFPNAIAIPSGPTLASTFAT